MAELIQEHSARLRGADGTIYIPYSCGEERGDGTWVGWIEFHPIRRKTKPVLRTERETTQPNRDALEYWATGLEQIYFEGAFRRAIKTDHAT